MTRITSYRSHTHWLRPRSYAPRASDRRSVKRIVQKSSALAAVSDERLAEFVKQLRHAVDGEQALDDAAIVESAFACVAEAVRRTLGMTYYDVQLLAGLVLASGSIAEMKTGEGKTLVSALPASLYALAGRGVHVATVNSYLAERDFETLAPVYERLGLTVGLLRDEDSPEEKRQAYACDVTYGTGYEFGFDYLRDQLALQGEGRMPLGDQFRRRLRGTATLSESTVQRGLAFGIIDEVDSVLIDEANTPLVISGPGAKSQSNPAVFMQARDLAVQLCEDEHFELDVQQKTLELTDAGLDVVFERQPVDIQRPWNIYIEQALRAKWIMQRNVDYVVSDGEIKIVDPYTGRIFSERTWRDGLHQAVEAKEGVHITSENRSLAQVSRQRFYQMYDVVCGMTGTACGHEHELENFYNLCVVRVPLRKPSLRQRMPPRVFSDVTSKLNAATSAIQELHWLGRPVLIGTRTISTSLLLSERLSELNLTHRVLNGIQDEDENHIVLGAGEQGMITIATNMAGRGTDIKLSEASQNAGGLHVLSLEFHESQRIDRQLEGRAARQGDPGSSQFFISAEDELLQKYDPKLADAIVQASGTSGESKRDFSAAIARVQRLAEKTSYENRCRVYQQQQWLNKVLTTITEPTRENKTIGSNRGAAA